MGNIYNKIDYNSDKIKLYRVTVVFFPNCNLINTSSNIGTISSSGLLNTTTTNANNISFRYKN